MKRIYISLNLSAATGRSELIGILRNVRADFDWDIRIVSREELPALLRSDAANSISGLITSLQPDEDLAAQLVAAPFPTILFSVERELIPDRITRLSIIKSDNEKIGRMGAQHFLSLGKFASYAFVHSLPIRDWSLERASAFRSALTATHVHVHDFPPRNDPAANNDAEALGRWLKALPHPAAVMAAYDQRAVEVINACKVAWLGIPEEVSVLGVDNDSLFCEHVVPTISSIRQDDETQGELAVRELKRLLRTRKPGCVRVTRVRPLGLVERGSTKVTTPSVHLIERAQLFIRDHACNAIRVGDVAAHLGVSRRLLDLRFRAATGSTVQNEIERVKFAAVDRAIVLGETSSRKIAAQCGFKSTKYLQSRFRKRNGQTLRAAITRLVDAHDSRQNRHQPLRLGVLIDDHLALREAPSPRECAERSQRPSRPVSARTTQDP